MFGRDSLLGGSAMRFSAVDPPRIVTVLAAAAALGDIDPAVTSQTPDVSPLARAPQHRLDPHLAEEVVGCDTHGHAPVWLIRRKAGRCVSSEHSVDQLYSRSLQERSEV